MISYGQRKLDNIVSDLFKASQGVSKRKGDQTHSFWEPSLLLSPVNLLLRINIHSGPEIDQLRPKSVLIVGL